MANMLVIPEFLHLSRTKYTHKEYYFVNALLKSVKSKLTKSPLRIFVLHEEKKYKFNSGINDHCTHRCNGYAIVFFQRIIPASGKAF